VRRSTVPAESIPAPEPADETLRPPSRRPLVLAIVALLVVSVGVAGIFGWYRVYGPGASHPTATLFDQAVAAYDRGAIDEALGKFQTVSESTMSGRFAYLPDSAKWWALLAEAHRAIDGRDLERASDRLARAETRGADRSRVEDVQRRIRESRLARRIERNLADGELTAVKQDLRRISGDRYGEELASVALKARDLVLRTDTDRKYDEFIRRAKQALDDGDFARAQLARGRAASITDTPEVRELEDDIRRAQSCDEWLRRGDAAMLDRDFASAVKAYDEANRLDPSDDIERRAQAARAHVLAGEAKQAFEDGDLLLARRKLLNSRWHYPLPQVAQELRRRRAAFEAARIAREADRAAAAGEIEKAIGLYESALRDLPEPTSTSVRNRLSELRHRQPSSTDGTGN